MAKNLFIETDLLISEGVVIQNFLLGEKAPNRKKGRSGGFIEIRAKKATGELSIILNGEDGGDGIRPLPITEVAENGLNGFSGRYFEEFGMPQNLRCRGFKPPTNGQDGKEGLKGENGFPGGNTGSFFIEVHDSKEFRLNYEIKPGLGGLGSLGGEGGYGGKGGILIIEDEKCKRNWSKFPDGKRGPVGKSGKRGATGDVGEICIKLNNKECK